MITPKHGSAENRNDKWWVALIGSGIALSPIHNQRLTDLATNSRGEVVFFLPAFGYLLLIMGTGMFLLNNWKRVREVGWGDRKITIPLIIIVAAMSLSGITAGSFTEGIAPLGMGLSLFAMYVAARVLGKDVFLPLAIGAAIASSGVIVHDVVNNQWTVTGGLVFEYNFDILTGYVFLGAALFFHKYRWVLSGLALIGLLLSGSPEAIPPLGVIGVAVLVRKDWSKRFIAVSAITVCIIVVVVAAGKGTNLYDYLWRTINNDTAMVNSAFPDGTAVSGSPLGFRWEQITRAMTNLKPLGDGYNATEFTLDTVHNVPLILVQQMGYPGILAALAWLWVTLWALFRTRWKYVWLLIITLSVFDHYIWDQLGPVWWTALGASMTSRVPDTLFKEVT